MKLIYSIFLAMLICLPLMAQTTTKVGYDQITLGNSTNVNKIFKFDIGNGSLNPLIRANDSTGQLEFSNDGTTFLNFGAVSGVATIANGGTNNGSLGVASGGVYYGDGSKIVQNTPGTSGQILISQGTSAPVFVNQYSAPAIAATSIDWASANSFTKTLAANTTFTFSNAVAGQNIVVRLTNTASNYTVTWPTVRWTGGTPPVMTVGAKSDVYTFYYDGSNFYGSVVQDMF